MADVVCRNCGQDFGFYRNVEVTGVGWVDVQVSGEADGSVASTEDDHVQEVQYDDRMKSPLEFGCSNCGDEKPYLALLVKVKDEDIDEALRRERNPIKGQLTFEGVR